MLTQIIFSCSEFLLFFFVVIVDMPMPSNKFGQKLFKQSFGQHYKYRKLLAIMKLYLLGVFFLIYTNNIKIEGQE